MTISDEAAAKAAFEGIAHDIGATSAEAGLQWLAAQEDEWLLVFDNTDDPSLDLSRWTPKCSYGNVIITTRNPECKLYSPGHAIELGEMAHEEACKLLLNLATVTATENTQQLASRIVEKLGCLALAVAQSGSFIAKSSTLEGFLALYDQHRAKLLQHQPQQNTADYAWSVYTTWEMNYSQLDDTATYFLKLCSYLHFAHIQWDIFRRAFARLTSVEFESAPPDLVTFFTALSNPDRQWDGFQFQDIIQQLRSFSMITLHSGESHSLHPLVHAWARDRLSFAEQSLLRKSAIRLLSISVPEGKAQTDIRYRTALLDHCVTLQILQEELTAAEADALGAIHMECSQYSIAQKLYHHAFYMQQHTNSDGRHCMIRAGASLGLAYMTLGKYAEAEDLFTGLLAIGMPYSSSEHGAILKVQSYMASTLSRSGRQSQAAEMLPQLIRKLQFTYGNTHYDTLEAMQFLGCAYSDMRRCAAAEKLLEQTAQLLAATLGETHPETLNTKSFLSDLYQVMGRYDEAAQIQGLVVESLRIVHGPDHYDILGATSILLAIKQKQGHLVEAEAIGLELVTKMKKHVGDRHPHTLISTHQLAVVLGTAGRLEEADTMFREVERLRSEVLGVGHRITLVSRSWLGENLFRQGRLREAQEVLEDVLEKHSALESPLWTMSATERRLGCVHLEQGRFHHGISLLISSLEKCAQIIGQGHPDTLDVMKTLADAYRRDQRVSEAEEVERDIIVRRERRAQELEEEAADVEDFMFEAGTEEAQTIVTA